MSLPHEKSRSSMRWVGVKRPMEDAVVSGPASTPFSPRPWVTVQNLRLHPAVTLAQAVKQREGACAGVLPRYFGTPIPVQDAGMALAARQEAGALTLKWWNPNAKIRTALFLVLPGRFSTFSRRWPCGKHEVCAPGTRCPVLLRLQMPSPRSSGQNVLCFRSLPVAV